MAYWITKLISYKQKLRHEKHRLWGEQVSDQAGTRYVPFVTTVAQNTSSREVDGM